MVILMIKYVRLCIFIYWDNKIFISLSAVLWKYFAIKI